MPDDAPIRFRLPDETVARLALPYEPYHWPNSAGFDFDSGEGFSVREPWPGHKEKKWYAEKRKPYDRLQALLAPHQDQWVLAGCVAALIPLEGKEGFAVQINGVELISSEFVLDGLRQRMTSAKLPIRVTTCGAIVQGGGLLLNGAKRGYGIALDIKPLPK